MSDVVDSGSLQLATVVDGGLPITARLEQFSIAFVRMVAAAAGCSVKSHETDYDGVVGVTPVTSVRPDADAPASDTRSPRTNRAARAVARIRKRSAPHAVGVVAVFPAAVLMTCDRLGCSGIRANGPTLLVVGTVDGPIRRSHALLGRFIGVKSPEGGESSTLGDQK
ncbi:hypothetical protein [Nocardia exalbida]|uniref:hypothetical protein n=1 Tax=Nocardia exalbida TaxID=290231 RepID=UPI0012F68B4C|nr:hypothetical protein [Nocardia exalbida]